MSRDLQTAIAMLAFRWADSADHRRFVTELWELAAQAKREGEAETLAKWAESDRNLIVRIAE